MRYFLFLIFLIALKGKSQSAGSVNSETSLLNAVNVTIPGSNSNTATEQASNWEMQVKQNPWNESNWLNYYLWTERKNDIEAKDKEKLLSQIIDDGKQYIAEKPQYQLLLFLKSGKKDTVSISKAIQMAGYELWLMPFAIQHFIIVNNKTLLQEYCLNLEHKQPLKSGLYQYYFNTLMSADTNAIIYARGLNDIVPMAILQQVYNIRKDISLKYYNGTIKDEKNTYLGLSLGKKIITQYPGAACTGLLVKITDEPTLEELKKHVEDFKLSELKSINTDEDLAELYKNYLPAFIMLYKYYKPLNMNKAGEIRNNILIIASATGMEKEVSQLLDK